MSRCIGGTGSTRGISGAGGIGRMGVRVQGVQDALTYNDREVGNYIFLGGAWAARSLRLRYD